MFASETNRNPGPFDNLVADTSAAARKTLVVPRSGAASSTLYVTVTPTGTTQVPFSMTVYQVRRMGLVA